MSRILFISSKCNGFIVFICLCHTPISEHNCLFGFLFIFPEPLNRIQTQIYSSGCCSLDFFLWKDIQLLNWMVAGERKEGKSEWRNGLY